MTDWTQERIALSTGITLNVAIAGDPANPPLVFLHGFPESHRTWRHQIREFAPDHFVIAPDQRGFAGSDKPEGVENYTADKPVADLIALADHFDIDRFTLVGHDWGGAIAWMAALQRPDRVARLVIVNAPHPLVFQKSLIDNAEQRAASQYMRALRNPETERLIATIGMSMFFDTSFAKHAHASLLFAEKPHYVADWSRPGAMTAMLNWYRASAIIVPEIGEVAEMPAFVTAPFPPVQPPTLVIWGMRDVALLPVQLEGLGDYAPKLTIKQVDSGHFVPWEKPEAVNAAMRNWLATTSFEQG